MPNVTKLDLLQAGVVVVLLTALAFVLQSGASTSQIWLVCLGFFAFFVVAVALNVLTRTKLKSRRLDQPVSEKAGGQLLEGAVGVWLALVVLLNVGMLTLGARASTGLGMLVGVLLLAGIVAGRLLQAPSSNRVVLAYGAGLTVSWILTTVVLVVAGVLDLSH